MSNILKTTTRYHWLLFNSPPQMVEPAFTGSVFLYSILPVWVHYSTCEQHAAGHAKIVVITIIFKALYIFWDDLDYQISNIVD
jgi:hypothetical protein